MLRRGRPRFMTKYERNFRKIMILINITKYDLMPYSVDSASKCDVAGDPI